MKILKYKSNIYFEKNLGQLPSNIEYKIKMNDYLALVEKDKLIVTLPSKIENAKNVFYMKFENKNTDVKIQGQDREQGIVNYFIGTDKSKWIRNIPTYSKIKYEGIYNDIDLYYYINNENLEYDFVLKNGANPDDICISFEGLDNITLNNDKNIVLTVGDAKAILLKPEVYQIIDNKKVNVECEYLLDRNNCVKFLVKEYQKEYELVLDPLLTLDYSTFLGGYLDTGTSTAIDYNSYVYICGYTMGGYPITPGAYQTSYGTDCDVFVTKVDSDGSRLVYSTYIGGVGVDKAYSIAVDEIGNAYITGTTNGGYPTTLGAFQTVYLRGKQDAFITKLNEFGNDLVYSTYLGALYYAIGNAIAIDEEGYAYIVGRTGSDYPTTPQAYQTSYRGGDDAFVTKISREGDSLVYSTYIGGSKNEDCNAIAVDSEGYAYITGSTGGDFPITPGVIQTINKGGADVFVTKLSRDGDSLIYSTYLGGDSDDVGHGITIDSKGYAYVVGSSQSINFPTVNPYQYSNAGGDDVFVSKIGIDGKSLIYSTYIGGSNTDIGEDIAVDNLGYAYIIGTTTSSNYPTKDAYQSNISGGKDDIFVTKLNLDGNSLIYSTYIGGYYKNYGNQGLGIVVDDIGCAYITGYTAGNYPVTPGAFQTTLPTWLVQATFSTKILPATYDLSWNYKPNKVKLLDVIKTKFTIKNLSRINFDINVKYQTLDSSLSYVSDSLSVQNISQKEIPDNIYLSNISPQKSVQLELDLLYNHETFPTKIPMTINFELYKNIDNVATLLDTISETFYIVTTVGPNYIPGCNKLYNLEIDGQIQMTSGGIPIIYYKYENSYIYIEPSDGKYIYKVLSNPSKVTEHIVYI